MHRQPELLHVVAAAHSPRRFAGRLDRRQQQPDHHPDDGDHHEQFDEREATSNRAAV
jgi:hypothetical protein